MEVKAKKISSQSFMKSLNTMYWVILLGMLIFGVIIIAVMPIPWMATIPSAADTFVFAVPLFTFIGVVLGRVLYKRTLDRLEKESGLKNKLIELKTAILIKYILVEAPFLLGVVATIQSNNIFYLMIAGTLVMYFITFKPSR